MTIDRFGDELYIDDVVVYADTNISGDTLSLDVYRVVELVDNFTCKGVLLNGLYAGNTFYLSDTTSRCAFVSEYHPPSEEEDELNEKPTLN